MTLNAGVCKIKNECIISETLLILCFASDNAVPAYLVNFVFPSYLVFFLVYISYTRNVLVINLEFGNFHVTAVSYSAKVSSLFWKLLFPNEIKSVQTYVTKYQRNFLVITMKFTLYKTLTTASRFQWLLKLLNLVKILRLSFRYRAIVVPFGGLQRCALLFQICELSVVLLTWSPPENFVDGWFSQEQN